MLGIDVVHPYLVLDTGYVTLFVHVGLTKAGLSFLHRKLPHKWRLEETSFDLGAQTMFTMKL